MSKIAEKWELVPGRVNLEYFRLLIAIRRIRNKRMINALERVLVSGLSRKEACYINGVSQGGLSIMIRELQFLSYLLEQVIKLDN